MAAVVAILLVVLVAGVGSPPAAAAAAPSPAPAPVPPLAARLHRAFSVALDGDEDGGGGGIVECWGALAQLGSCSSEMVLFLFDGASYIGPECCRAVRGATRHCWPAMLASVGFTAEQADVLRGFCDGEEAAVGQHQQDANAPPAAAVTKP